MIAQRDTQWVGKVPPIRYDALEKCLKAVYKRAYALGCTVHAPRIGCVLAGGDWKYISQLIIKIMTVETFVYTLEKQKDRWKDPYENG
jgi:O-acetyl-ADP-ribose deacetylase (regulator of RNase III)